MIQYFGRPNIILKVKGAIMSPTKIYYIISLLLLLNILSSPQMCYPAFVI